MLKVTCLEKNVAYFKSEVTTVEYKYEVMKNKLKQEKKSHRADNAANEAKIAALSQQLAFMMSASGAANPAAAMTSFSNPMNMFPFQLATQTATTTTLPSEDESVDVPVNLKNPNQKPPTE